MLFLRLQKIKRPCITPCTMLAKLSSMRIKSAASLAMSDPLPIAMPTSACERQRAWQRVGRQAMSSSLAAINAAYLVFRSSHYLGQARWHSNVLDRAWLQSKRQASWPGTLRRQTTVGGVCQRWPRVGQRQKAGLAWLLYILPIWQTFCSWLR